MAVPSPNMPAAGDGVPELDGVGGVDVPRPEVPQVQPRPAVQQVEHARPGAGPDHLNSKLTLLFMQRVLHLQDGLVVHGAGPGDQRPLVAGLVQPDGSVLAGHQQVRLLEGAECKGGAGRAALDLSPEHSGTAKQFQT